MPTIKKYACSINILTSDLMKDPKLTARSKVIFCVLYSFPHNYDFSINYLKNFVKAKTRKIIKSIMELEKNGYIHLQNVEDQPNIYTFCYLLKPNK